MTQQRIAQHPGIALQKELERLGMSQKELAIRTGVTDKHVSTIINGTKGISAAYARKLEYALGTDENYWGKLQAEYDLAMVRIQEEHHISEEEIALLKRLKDIISYFLARGILHNDCGDTEKVLQLRSILRVSDLTLIPHISYNAAYRAQLNNNTKIDPFVLFAWQRLCEIRLEDEMPEVPFSADSLRDSLADIKATMFLDINAALKQLRGIFARSGIGFAVVQHFRGAPVQGFIKSTDRGQVILCLTIRGKGADRFWFSLFHEIGHLINGDLKNRFIDFDSVKSDAEEKADQFARDALLDPQLYKNWRSSCSDFTLHSIQAFAREAGVPYWIVIGRLHSDEWLDWSVYAKQIPSYSWAQDA